MELTKNQWEEMDQENKDHYRELSKQDQLRYKNQKNQFKALGFFILLNGLKSTEVPKNNTSKYWRISDYKGDIN